MAIKIAYKRIVVGVDFSEASLAALAHAVFLAQQCDAQLEIVHVLEDSNAPPWSSASRAAVQRQRKTDLAEASKALSALAAKQPGGIAIREHVLTGAAYSKIVSFAKRKKADLIVVANAGRSRLVDVLIGSTAHRMLGRSTVPLLLVPTTSSRRRPK